MRVRLALLTLAAALGSRADATTYVQYNVTVEGYHSLVSYLGLAPRVIGNYVRTYTINLSSDFPGIAGGDSVVLTATGLSVGRNTPFFRNRFGISFADDGLSTPFPDLATSDITASFAIYQYTGPSGGGGGYYDDFSARVTGISTRLATSAFGPAGITENYVEYPVPEPATWMQMLLGFLGIGLALRGGSAFHRMRPAKLTTLARAA